MKNCDHCHYFFSEDGTCRKHAPRPDNNTILIESKQVWRAIWPRIEDPSVDLCGEFKYWEGPELRASMASILEAASGE